MITKILTHLDLDGVVCEILLRRIFGSCAVTKVSYSNIETILRGFFEMGTYLKYDRVVIADLSVTDFCTDLIEPILRKEDGKLLLFDHHPASLLFEFYKTCFINTKVCAAAIIYNQYKNQVDLKDLATLAMLANDYDTGACKYDLSRHLSYLFYHYWDKFVPRFSSGLSPFDKKEKEFIAKKDAELEDCWKEAESSAQSFADGKVVVVVLREFINEISARFLNKGAVIVLSVIPKTGRISLRSNTEDVEKIANKFEGGGHKFAASCLIEKMDDLVSFLELKHKY